MIVSHPSKPSFTLEDALHLIAPRFSKQADTLLDLHHYGVKRQHPGKCVDCYFRLYADAAPAELQNLAPLREWLERNIEIVAADQRQNLLEKFPLRLDSRDLESFCRNIIQILRNDRAFPTPAISLDFAFKP
jgi:hypothetical protein